MTATSPLLGDAVRSDIQGFITSGYGHLPVAAYLFVRIADPAAGRGWIGDLVEAIATAAPWPRDAAGAVIKPPIAIERCVYRRRLACMRTAVVRVVHLSGRVPGRYRRARPVQASRRHGGERAEHVGARETGRRAHPRGPHRPREQRARPRCGLRLRAVAHSSGTGGGVVCRAGSGQRGYRPSSDTEPFGFRDGIAQPSIAGIVGHGVPTGEFILGYPNHYDVIPPTPVVPASLDPRGLLAALENPYHATGGWRDFGRHGSFVVYRKLQQHVAAFWRALREETIRRRGVDDDRLYDLARIEDGRPVAKRSTARGGAARRRPDACDELTRSSTAAIRMASPARSARTSGGRTRATISSRTPPSNRVT